jgi:Peroxiredoxin
MPVNASNSDLDWKAPDFNLISVDEQYYSLGQLTGENGTLIAFICNHCPYVIRIIERFVYESIELNNIGVSTIAIMSNDVKQYPEDSYEKMKEFSLKYDFKFHYLYDSTQQVAKDYRAVCTPDIFGFNKNLQLKYRGRIDSKVVEEDNNDIKREMYEAMKLIKETKEGPSNQFNSFGCSIKWANNE